MAKIGPNFGFEVIAAGLGGLPFGWGDDGIFFGREALTDEQNHKLDEVIAAHDPNKQPLATFIISRRQFYQASAMHGMITKEEALDAVRHGTIPAQMQAGIDTLPPDEKFAAEMLLSGAGEFERNHPLVEKFAVIMGMTPAQADDIWRFAATL